MRLLETYGVTVALDVGANAGQFGQELREIGFRGRIISFEPLLDAFDTLRTIAEGDALWDAHNIGLGDRTETLTINIANNSASSSILPMLSRCEESAPEAKYIGTTSISILTLDSFLESSPLGDKEILLKIDTQGYEKKVLDGASSSLCRINTIQLEMSLVPLYDGEILFSEMHEVMSSLGYLLVSIEPGFSDKVTGEMFQLDGIYRRANTIHTSNR